MPEEKVYYDKKKYKLSDSMPNKWAQIVPEFGHKEFEKKYLTDEDLEALIKAGSPHVTRKA